MLDALVMLASSAGEEETSKTFFYVAGSVLAAWAVVLAFLGLRSTSFPGNTTGARAVMAISSVLVAMAMISAVVTA